MRNEGNRGMRPSPHSSPITLNFKVVIPARYASTRLPGKPLADIAGKPMVVRVAERALQSGAIRSVGRDRPCTAWPKRCARMESMSA